jgi:feruloyl esterase
LPAFCRVTGEIKPEIKFEVWLPANWNGKFLAVGNGGLAGSINYRAMTEPLKRGYATASTDTGHSGGTGDASWALGHFERVVDFAHRGVHVMTESAKAIVQAFYESPAKHSYFTGCSQGGQEALMEAQRYPNDYDGIVAGDPANFWTHHYIGGHLWVVQTLEKEPASYIPASKIPVIAKAVLDRCDEIDGIKDGILNDPTRCHFDPAVLACHGADEPNCLTAAQVKTVKKLYAGPRDAEGKQIYPGLLPGGEDGPGGWAAWISGPEPGKSLHFNLGIPYLKYVAFEDPTWDFRSFNFDKTKKLGVEFESDVDFVDDKLAAISNAVDPDLRPFQERGGKLIQYHGWSDPDISPLNSVNYYQRVVAFMGHGGGKSQIYHFYRLFMVPGMQHCGGGPGPNVFDTLSAMEQWVEHGVAPEKIVASHMTNGAKDRTRPLCPYPKQAKWTGKGSTDDAANFTCELPGESARQ